MAGGAAPIGKSEVSLKYLLKHGFLKREFLPAFCLVTSLFFLCFCYGLLDVLNKHFQNTLDITKTQSTGLQVAYFGWGYFFFSPFAGEVLKRYGYKKTILMGLSLYSLGAILFWPCAHFAGKPGHSNNAIFAGFVICTGITASGLATLEVSASSYITVMTPTSLAALRLTLSQSFNGVASFSGPLIASKYFFSEEHADDLTNVQYVYMAVAGMGLIVAILFLFVPLPEVSEEELAAESVAVETNHAITAKEQKPFYKQYYMIAGFWAQFMYTGAQVTIGAFFINYVFDTGRTDAEASHLLSYSLILFTVFRFIMTAVLGVVSSSVVLFVNAFIATILTVLTSTLHGSAGIACLMLVYCTMSAQYPIIFVLATANLGRHTRRAASFLIMAIAGGAVFPPIQGAIADAKSTRVSMWLSVPAFGYVTLFAAYTWWTGDRAILLRAKLPVAPTQVEGHGHEHEKASVSMDEKRNRE